MASGTASSDFPIALLICLQSTLLTAGNGPGSPGDSEHRSKKKKKRKEKDEGSAAELAGQTTEPSLAADDQPQKKLKLTISLNK